MRTLKKLLSLLVATGLLTAVPTTASAASAPNLSKASTWAQPQITETCELGFVTPEILDDYTQPITRAEFCRLAVSWVEYIADKGAEKIIAERGHTILPTFTDTNDPAIIAAAALGITSGTGGGMFGMDVTFDRQQAAGMTWNAYKVIQPDMATVEPNPAPWSDMSRVSEYAKAGVQWMTQLGFFSGVGNNSFGPDLPFSREQAIILFGNMAKSFKGAGSAVVLDFINLMKSDSYYIDFTGYGEMSGQTVDLSGTFAVDGPNIHSRMSMKMSGNTIAMWFITKDGKTYMIDEAAKTATALNDSGSNLSVAGFGDVKIGEGTGAVNGKTLPYEEYIDNDTGDKSKYFIESGKVCAIEFDYSDGSKAIMIISEYGKPPAGVFDLPAGYSIS
jgi:hypothetical protein